METNLEMMERKVEIKYLQKCEREIYKDILYVLNKKMTKEEQQKFFGLFHKYIEIQIELERYCNE